MSEEALYKVFEKLIETSRRRGLIYYYELNKCLPEKNASNFLNPFQPLFNVLNTLNDFLVTHNFPMITSLVVNKNTGLPGKGFFYYAKKLCVYKGELESKYGKMEFWNKERERSYNFEWDKSLSASE